MKPFKHGSPGYILIAAILNLKKGIDYIILFYINLIALFFRNILNSKDKYPILLMILVTSKCPRAYYCRNCWRPAETLINKDIGLDSIEKAARAGIPVILVSGGEPTEHRQFPEIIDRLEKSGSLIFILTNGYRCDLIIKSVHEKNRVRVILSANSYDSVEKLEMIHEAIRKLLEAKLRVYLNIPVVCGSLDIDFLNRIKKLLKLAIRIHITRYADATCVCSDDDFIWMKKYAKYISRESSAKHIFVTAPFPKYMLPIYRFFAFLAEEKFTKCSGFPFRAIMNEEGRIIDCIRKQGNICHENF